MQALLVLAGFCGLAVAWTWPLAAYLDTRAAHDPGDPILNVWLVWWNAQAVPFTRTWWSPPFFHPLPGALALSEHLAGLGLITTPLQLAGTSPLAAYNVALILSFALSAFFAYLLALRLTGSRGAALCAGLAFGFAPYRAGQLAHLQVLTSQWMPLALLAMHAYVDSGRRIWLAAFAAAWLTQALSNGYYLLFFPVLAGGWLLWFGRSRRGAVLAVTWAAASLLLVPPLLEYVRVQRRLGLSRTVGEMTLFSATPQAFLRPAGMLAAWPSAPAANEELYLFPGVASVLLAAAGALHGWRRRDSTASFYVIAAIVLFACTLGPGHPGAVLDALTHPYSLLVRLPGFDGLRVPARFAMLGVCCLALAAAAGFSSLAGGSRARRIIVTSVALIGLLVDGWMRPMPLVAPPGRAVLPEVSGAIVLELPAREGIVNTAAMYRSMQHGRPLVNGYSGHTPPHYVVLTTALDRGDASVLETLAAGRPVVVIVNDRHDADGALRRLVEALPGVSRHGSTAAGSIVLVPARPRVNEPPLGADLPFTIVSRTGNAVELDLGHRQSIRGVEFALRWHAAELDPRFAVEVSEDRRTWTTVWEGWSGGRAFIGALEDPQRIPVRLTVPDARARFVRVHPAPQWLTDELRVRGPG